MKYVAGVSGWGLGSPADLGWLACKVWFGGRAGGGGIKWGKSV